MYRQQKVGAPFKPFFGLSGITRLSTRRRPSAQALDRSRTKKLIWASLAESSPGGSPGFPAALQSPSVLPGGNDMPPLVAGSVQHVDTSGVHMLGHLEDLIEFVVQGRFASRSGQRIFTRSQSKFVCTHNEYWYTSVRTCRKCANLTITYPQMGQRASPLDHTPGYP